MAQSARISTTGPDSVDLELEVRRWGNRIFAVMDQVESRSIFSRQRFYRALMEWAMQDAEFKTQLFRFIDVLPSLRSASAVTRHLREYLSDTRVRLSPALRLALKSSTAAPWLVGLAVKHQVSHLARQFMLGDEPRKIVAALQRLAEQQVDFTMDVLGETVVSEAEAEVYARRYLSLIELIAPEIPRWRKAAEVHAPNGRVPRLNLSVKLSALSSQIHPTDPETAVEKITQRLRPILRRARETGGLINFDMEQDALRALTLRVFKSVFGEPEFARGPACGLALQAYLKDSEEDLWDVLRWAEQRERPVSVRLVKGAYWDYETVIAAQKGWAVPVFEHKVETDANYEKLSMLLLEHWQRVQPAFGTHNVRSIAHVLAQADRLNVPKDAFEFQMLHGMAESTKQALVQLGYRVREYCPVGELLPGMAYLVRRLLENTSNEGFLARSHRSHAEREELLRNPAEASSLTSGKAKLRVAPPVADEHLSNVGSADGPLGTRAASTPSSLQPTVVIRETGFRNEPSTDFRHPEERKRMATALATARRELGRHYPLIIDNQPCSTADWLTSLNPANQTEIIGYAAQASLKEAAAALAAARRAGQAWARTPAEGRAAVLERLADLLRREKANLCAVEILEAGKNWTEADADVAEAIDFCGFYASVMRDLGEPHVTQKVAGERNVQHWWPRGTALVVAPWNFPLAILTGMTAAAAVSGNTVIVKPSDETPVLAARLMEVMIEAGLPQAVINLLMGPGDTVGAHLVSHPEIDVIAFTGSKQVGLKIWEAAGRTERGQAGLKKVICEMGGKNAIIVDSDADLDEAITGIVASAFGYQGQKCSALSRLIVLAKAYDRVLERLVAATASLRVGPAEDAGTVFGPVISRQAQKRILATIDAGQSEATLLWQGQVPQVPEACYVPPTIFVDVPRQSRLFQEEIFGPVLAVSRAKDFEEALRLANATEFALTGGLYSRSPVNIERATREFVCGNLYINRTITGAIVGRQPFGGFKMSGGGTKAGGRAYLENFMLPRVVTENTLRRGFAPE
jgi:RHH-type proline utilization regulon transcriptional repressor/proline dehydrogenase/delta 1-pyrroline-5-carboxylate dehydrogenase